VDRVAPAGVTLPRQRREGIGDDAIRVRQRLRIKVFELPSSGSGLTRCLKITLPSTGSRASSAPRHFPCARSNAHQSIERGSVMQAGLQSQPQW
jgi:hypothetical protein